MIDNKKYGVSMGVRDDSLGRTYCDVRITTEDEKLTKLLKQKFANGDKEFIEEFIKLLKDAPVK